MSHLLVLVELYTTSVHNFCTLEKDKNSPFCPAFSSMGREEIHPISPMNYTSAPHTQPQQREYTIPQPHVYNYQQVESRLKEVKSQLQ